MIWLYFNLLSPAAVLTIDYKGKGRIRTIYEFALINLVCISLIIFTSLIISTLATEILGTAL